MNDHDIQETFKIVMVWVAALAGTMTLNQILIVATLIYTLLQIFMICRRLWKGQP